MRSLPFRIPKAGSASLHLQEDHLPDVYDWLHHHPELQISLIEFGAGTVFAGGRIRSFGKGDLFLFGPEQPHAFRFDPEFTGDSEKRLAFRSVFFEEDLFGEDFMALPEMSGLSELLAAANRGLSFSPDMADAGLLRALWKAEGYRRLTGLLDLLGSLAQKLATASYLSGPEGPKLRRPADAERLHTVFELIMRNYHREIRLEEAAEAAHMSLSAFCRYFRLHTRKTFVQVLNEIRVDMACKLLATTEKPVGEIAFQCGFNNLANFHRRFRGITGQSPLAYRKAVLERQHKA